jgi:hypothetical protein
MAPPQNGQDPNLANALAKAGGSSGSGSSDSASSSLGGAGKGSLSGGGADKDQAAVDKAQNTQWDNQSKAADKESAQSYKDTDPNRYDATGNLLPEDAYSANTSRTAAGAQGEIDPKDTGFSTQQDGQGSAVTPPVQDAGLLGPSGDPGNENNGLGDGIGGIIDNVVAGGYGNAGGYNNSGGDSSSSDYSSGDNSGGDSGNTYGGADNTGDGSGD